MPYGSRTLRNVSLRQLRVFESVARLSSFTRAARELHLTQPAVSMQVKELEAGCGLPLLERAGRGIRLTEAGAELARCAAGVAEQLELARERLDALRGVRTGLLKLGAVSTAKYFAPSLLAAFQSRYPGVSIRFAVGNRDEVLRQLSAHTIDLAIMGRPPAGLDVVAEPFAAHPLAIVAAPAHRLAGRRRVPLRALAQESFLVREEGSGTRAAMEALFADRGLAYRSGMEMSSNETIKQAVMAGMGVSMLSLHTVGLELQAGRLVVLDVAGLPILRDWHVLHLRTKRLLPLAAAFRDFILRDGAGLLEAAVGLSAGRPVRRTRRAVRRA
jgi:DNA-binding transcriptional LysR family regulator